jgi:glycosyltransferase involved in cell wall biosynthesis
VKIEMVLPMLASAGMEVMVARMAGKLAGRGHSVGITCITERGPTADEVEATGVRVSEVGAQGLANPRWLLRLRKHFRDIDPDIVHVHSGSWFKGALGARFARVPVVVYTAHGFVSTGNVSESILNRVAVKFTDRVVSVSADLAPLLQSQGIAGKRMVTIANGIDIDLFNPNAATGEIRRRLGIAPSTVIVGTVARHEPIKNLAMLIEAIAAARQRGADCEAVLIGDGSLRADHEALAEKLGIRARVHFWGVDTNTARLHPELDIFTLTSDAEGTSISLLEAMASGVCPIATRVGGNPALVGEPAEGAGLMVEPRRPDQLADAIVALAADATRRTTKGAAARTRVAKHFSDEAMLDAYEALYADSLLGGRRGNSSPLKAPLPPPWRGGGA